MTIYSISFCVILFQYTTTYSNKISEDFVCLIVDLITEMKERWDTMKFNFYNHNMQITRKNSIHRSPFLFVFFWLKRAIWCDFFYEHKNVWIFHKRFDETHARDY